MIAIVQFFGTYSSPLNREDRSTAAIHIFDRIILQTQILSHFPLLIF